jgi:hypothetical protein
MDTVVVEVRLGGRAEKVRVIPGTTPEKFTDLVRTVFGIAVEVLISFKDEEDCGLDTEAVLSLARGTLHQTMGPVGCSPCR